MNKGGDLSRISPPRLVKPLEILAPDLLASYRSAEKRPWAFFAARPNDVFGVIAGDMMLDEGGGRDLSWLKPDGTVALRIDGFLRQNVIAIGPEWVTRREVLRYVPNVGGGVHSGLAEEKSEHLVSRARRIARITLTDDIPTFICDVHAMGSINTPVVYDPKAIDVSLWQVMSAAQYLISSPDVRALRTAIEAEL